MQCTRCGYALWSIAGRTCPECGLSFVLGDYEFIPGALRFCCPKCDHAYVGEGWKGHVARAVFDCDGCGETITFDSMVARPSNDGEASVVEIRVAPLMKRGERGLVSAWISTFRDGLMRPRRCIAPLGDNRTLIVLLFAGASGLIPAALIISVIVELTGGSGGMVVLAVLAALYATLIISTAILAHLSLRPQGNLAGGFSRTLQPICLSSAPLAIALWLTSTFVGVLVAWIGLIWWINAAAHALERSQRIDAIRAGETMFASAMSGVLTIAIVVVTTWLLIES